MKIYNEQGEEIQESDVDISKGYLKSDKIFVQHHEEVQEQEEKNHYEVKTFYFEDGDRLDVSGNTDPHVDVIDDQNGIFGYIDQGEEKELRGIDLETVVDKEKVEHKDAYDEYEDINRYILYTEEELKAQAEQQKAAEKRESFLTNGPDQLDSNTVSIEDLTVLMSEMIGGAE